MRLKLFLGRLFDWDKVALQAFIVMIAIPIVFLSAVIGVDAVEDWIDPDKPLDCNQECIDQLVREIDTDRIVRESIEESR
jgi:hypothetical protein